MPAGGDPSELVPYAAKAGAVALKVVVILLVCIGVAVGSLL